MVGGRGQVEFCFTSVAGSGKKGPAAWKQLAVVNNGRCFSDEDFTRVARIAEGNPDVDAIGQFGVGFYATFGLSDAPVIVSGRESLVFQWAGPRLATYRGAADAPAFTGGDGSSRATTAVVMELIDSSRQWEWDKLNVFLTRAVCFINHVERGEGVCC